MKIKSLLLVGFLALPIHHLNAQDAAATATAVQTISGKVAETMSTAGYTYVLVDTGGKKVWAAAVQFPVKVGDSVSFAAGDAMPNYHSKSLNRDFDLVYFTGGINVNEAGASASGAAPKLPPGHPALPSDPASKLPPGHPPLTAAKEAPKVDLTGIKKAAGGKTIEEIFAAQSKLAGKSISVRGKIVKYNSQIMGKNWLHIQDGSGVADKNNNDLTVTTLTTAKLGDTVLVTGKVSTSKDFGAGYKYTVIIEDAKVVVE